MNAIRLSEGEKIDHTPAAAVGSGAIVGVGELLGMAEQPIAASALGALALGGGVFRLIKSGVSTIAFEIGDAVFWNSTTGLATRIGGSGCRYFGTCVEAAGATQAWVNVLFDPHNLPGEMADMLWEDVDVSGGSKTLDIQDCGKVMNVTVGHAANGIILPACVAGFEFVVRCGTTGQRVFLDPDASGTADLFCGPDFAGTIGKGRILAAATSRKGDYVHVAFGAADSWVILAQRGIWTEEA